MPNFYGRNCHSGIVFIMYMPHLSCCVSVGHPKGILYRWPYDRNCCPVSVVLCAFLITPVLLVPLDLWQILLSSECCVMRISDHSCFVGVDSAQWSSAAELAAEGLVHWQFCHPHHQGFVQRHGCALWVAWFCVWLFVFLLLASCFSFFVCLFVQSVCFLSFFICSLSCFVSSTLNMIFFFRI